MLLSSALAAQTLAADRQNCREKRQGAGEFASRRTVLGTSWALAAFEAAPGAFREDRVVVKFREGLRARLAELRPLAAGSVRDLVLLEGARRLPLPQVLQGRVLTRHFERPAAELEAERAAILARRPELELADLANYYRVSCGGRAECARVLRALDGDARVEMAFVEFAPSAHVPAVLPQGRTRDRRKKPGASRRTVGSELETPDFEAKQAWLGAGPDGIGAQPAHAVLGAQGRPGQKVVQIEGAWILGHEDVPGLRPANVLGPIQFGSWDAATWRDHGSAAAGIAGAARNSFGVRGVVPRSELHVSSVVHGGGNAVSRATKVAQAGDVFTSSLVYAVVLGNNGFHAPFDHPQDVYDAIRIAVAKGIVVTCAAGNTGNDLANSTLYGARYASWATPSGAWLVGATFQNARKKVSWSNYGDRVRFSAWGAGVATVAYGQLFRSAKDLERRSYTDIFGGTSAASPQVAGVAAALQAALWENERRVLGVEELARALERDATAISGRVGPRPDLAASLRSLGLSGALSLQSEAWRGRATTITVRASSARPFALFFGARRGFARPPEFSTPLLLDPAGVFAVFPGVVPASGEATVSFPIPARESLADASAFVQAILLPTTSNARAELSNAIELWIR